MLGALGRRLETAFGDYIRRRTPSSRPPIRLSRRRLYILPTRSGGIFALVLLVMLLGATNYSNSLGFALTFWLGALALVSMHHAHGNLVGLRIDSAQARPVFAGDEARFEIMLGHDSRRTRRAIRVGTGEHETGAGVDVAPDATAPITIATPAAARGRIACPRLRLDSIYPLGLFRAWSWVTPRAETLVYPRPSGTQRLPAPDGGRRNASASRDRGHDEFAGHRRHVPGDSIRHVDWKASARSDDLLIREHSDQAGRTLWLDYNRLAGMTYEARLSQLTLWVVNAEHMGLRYGLNLPDEQFGPDHGSDHYRSCLRALALL